MSKACALYANLGPDSCSGRGSSPVIAFEVDTVPILVKTIGEFLHFIRQVAH